MNESFQCPGFEAAGIAAGIKKGHIPDLGLIYSRTPATVAAMFTRNKIQAAPVLVTKNRATAGSARAVVVNAGNANCCTGPQGVADALAMTAATAAALKLPPEQVLVASTGVIGAPLPSFIKAISYRIVSS